MTLRRKLLGGLFVAAIGVTPMLQPAAPTSAAPEPDLSRAIDLVQADLAEAPDLSRGTDTPQPRTVAFQAPRDSADAGTDSFAGPPTTIFCRLLAIPPRTLVPTKIEAIGRAECTWPMPTMVVGVSLFRGSSKVSTAGGTGFGRQTFQVTTFGPCRSGTYTGVATATIFPPPGYSPAFRQFGTVSVPVPINAAGTAVPPLVCRGSTPPPPTPPPPSGGPVINSLHCEYTGNSQFFCSLSASGWTQIRWSLNGSARTAWNDQTTVNGLCNGSTRVDVRVSNSQGTTERNSFINCVGEAP